ncbi:MAG: DUF480 domain-containing protein [Planctomycetota bacterium]
MKLEPSEERILGVLIEKELAVPDSYPLTENALLGGCNQKNNRDPVMSLEDFQLSGALAAMMEKGIVLRVSQSGSRTVRWKHLCPEKLGLNGREQAVLAELLLRGPQAPGALKPRVARMGMVATPSEILVVLEGLRARADGSLVEQLPPQPRERDQRWAQLLGGAASVTDTAALAQPRLSADMPPPTSETPPASAAPVAERSEDLASRVVRLERQLLELRAEVVRLGGQAEDAG